MNIFNEKSVLRQFYKVASVQVGCEPILTKILFLYSLNPYDSPKKCGGCSDASGHQTYPNIYYKKSENCFFH